jgi:hypothetical protein
MRGAPQPLAHAGARDVVPASDLGDVDAAIDAGDCREDVPHVVGLPG